MSSRASLFVGTSSATMIFSAVFVILSSNLSCRTIRDSSTSLGMTEQIARNYANPRSREDKPFAENSRPAERWLPRTRYAHRADFALRRDQNREKGVGKRNQLSLRRSISSAGRRQSGYPSSEG